MRGGLFERQILGGLAEIQLRRGFDAVGAVTEVDLVAVEGEDLFLGVALLDPDRDERLLDLALPAAVADREADLVGKMLRVSCCVIVLPPGERPRDRDVAHQRQHHARDAEAGVLEEAGVFRGEDRLPQVRRDVVVVNDHAPLDGEFADQLTVLAEHARDGVRRVVVERADFGQVVGVGEQHAAQACRAAPRRRTGRRCRRDARNERRLSWGGAPLRLLPAHELPAARFAAGACRSLRRRCPIGCGAAGSPPRGCVVSLRRVAIGVHALVKPGTFAIVIGRLRSNRSVGEAGDMSGCA